LVEDQTIIPIIVPSQADLSKIVKLVETILTIKKENPNAEILNLEKQIDFLIYQLYGITEKWITIIENTESD
jgi:hypothetical protein